jgi:hypothetical protein
MLSLCMRFISSLLLLSSTLAAPDRFHCALTPAIMIDPVMCSDGITYERAAIEKWLDQSRSSPVTGEKIGALELLPQEALQETIHAFLLARVDQDGLTPRGTGREEGDPSRSVERPCSLRGSARKVMPQPLGDRPASSQVIRVVWFDNWRLLFRTEGGDRAHVRKAWLCLLLVLSFW